MYDALLEKALASVESLKLHLVSSSAIRKHIYSVLAAQETITDLDGDAYTALDWAVLDHCLIVTRLYAILENYVHQVLTQHLTLLQQSLLYSDLPSATVKQHRLGLSKILEKKEGPRYASIDLKNILTEYNKALAKVPYKIPPEAILMHDHNLRLPELKRLLTTCGIEETEAWITNNPKMTAFFNGGDRIAASAEKELSELIEYRNEAAHFGIVVDEVLGTDGLLEFCDFIHTFIEVLSQKVVSDGLNLLKNNNKAFLLGTLTEHFKKNDAFIIKMNGKIFLGQELYAANTNFCVRGNIIGLQLNNTDIKEYKATLPDEEIGIKFSQSLTVNTKLYFLPDTNEDLSDLKAFEDSFTILSDN